MNCEENCRLSGSDLGQRVTRPVGELANLDQVASDCWVEIAGDDRWQIYQRLQSLGCDCTCAIGQPVRLNLRSPQDVVQAWMVMRHRLSGLADRRGALLATLETCWRLS